MQYRCLDCNHLLTYYTRGDYLCEHCGASYDEHELKARQSLETAQDFYECD